MARTKVNQKAITEKAIKKLADYLKSCDNSFNTKENARISNDANYVPLDNNYIYEENNYKLINHEAYNLDFEGQKAPVRHGDFNYRGLNQEDGYIKSFSDTELKKNQQMTNVIGVQGPNDSLDTEKRRYLRRSMISDEADGGDDGYRRIEKRKSSIKPEIEISEKLSLIKENYKRKIAEMLLQKKTELLETIKKEKYDALGNLPPEIEKTPYITYLIGMKNKYVGDKIVIKSKKEIQSKKPSVKISIDDQTVIFEGSKIKLEGNAGKFKNSNFINMVKNAYKNCFMKKK